VIVNRTSLRLGRAVASVSALVAGLVWFSAPPASASFGIALRPGHADPNDPSTKAFFKPTVAPGKTFTDEVIVTNTGDTPIDLVVSGVDGLTAPTSGAVYGNRQDPVNETGAWVRSAKGAVTVPPHAELAVPFTVTVPKDIRPGDHLAGIAFEDVHPSSAGGNFAVTQIVRAVMGVQTIVPGPGAFAVHIDDAALQSLPGVGAASVLVTLGNNGVRLGKPSLSVALSGPKGYQRTVVRTLDTILPGDTIAYPFAWPDVLLPGEYSITATATAPSGGAPVVHHASTKLGQALGGVPAPGVVTPAPAGDTRRGYTAMWAVVILVAAAGIGGGLYLGRRSHGRKPAATEERVLVTEGASRYPVER
jgi:WxL interacting protein linking bacterial and host surfaces